MRLDTISNDLALKAQSGDRRSIDKIVPRLYQKATRQAKNLGATHIERDDLVQDAVAGVLEALDKWDSEKYPRFESWCTLVMRRAVLNSAGDYYYGAKLPHASVQRYWKAMKENNSFEEAVESLAGVMRREAVVAIHEIVNECYPAHLVAGVGYDGSVEGEIDYAGLEYVDAPQLVDDNDVVTAMDMSALMDACLDPRERLIVEDFMAGYTNVEISERLAIDTSRVSRIRSRAFDKLYKQADQYLTEEYYGYR